ncbi:MAG: hypothetical protein ABIV28_07455 [Longimicrobiales bacterium]
MTVRRLMVCALVLLMGACKGSDAIDKAVVSTDSAAVDARTDAAFAPLAEQYVKLVLAVGQHDGGYVDAYYGPAEWQDQAKQQKMSLDSIGSHAARLLMQVNAIDIQSASVLVQLRKAFLTKQLESLQAYSRMLQGEKMKFDDESRALYNAVAPTYPESHFASMLDSLSTLLPGEGTVAQRLEAYKRDFIIPKEKLDTVFRAAIAEGRRRTAAHVTLPANESFVLEFVADKPWSGYNWYKGKASSLIQINTELPIYIERAIDVGAHEGYPGHHVYNALLEQNLVNGRKWPEYSVYPLFSPMSLIAEGSANYGIDVAFPGAERVAFERDVLYPLAGLDPARAEEYARVRALADRMSYAGNEAARAYLNGDITADSAAHWLTTYALMEPARAKQRIKFFDTYRSYVINYNYGRDMVGRYVESHGGTASDPEKRWSVFKELLSSPRLPSDLVSK